MWYNKLKENEVVIMKLKNPVKLFKEPVKTIDEVEQRKKDIKPWFIISGVLCLVGIGVLGLMIFGFLYIMANRIKKKMECLTCDNCNKMASFQNIEEFKKYVTYTIVGGKAKYKGAKHTVINQGIDAIVEAQADASAIVYISLTCPHCGTTKQLEYYITPFICSKREEKVSIRDVEVLKSRFERLVKEVVEVFNDPLRHHEIPYTIHSVNHPNYEERGKLQLDSSKVYGYYNGVKIEYHRDVEELVEGFFVHNEINGKIIESNNKAKSKKNKKELTQENEVKEETLKLDEECEEVQNPQNNVQTNEKQKSNLVIGSDHIEVSLDDSNEQINQSENKNELIVDENLVVNKESEPEKNSKIIENLEVLKKLKELLDLDVITQKEFEEKKILLLDFGERKQEVQSTKHYVSTSTKSQKRFRILNFLLTILTIVAFMVGTIFLLALDFRYYAGSFAPDYQQVWLYLPFLRAAFSSQNVVDVAVWCLFILIGAILMLVSLTIKFIIEIKQNNNKKIIILDIITILISAIAIIPSAIIVDWAKPGVKLFLILTSSCDIAILVHLFSLLIRKFLNIYKLLTNKM